MRATSGSTRAAVAERRERDEEGAVREAPERVAGERDREARLADAAGAEHRQQARPLEQLRGGGELGLPADERGRGHRQVRDRERAERREVVVAELEQPLGLGEVAEPVLAEVAHGVRGDPRARRLREDDLAAVRDGRDAGAAVDVEAHVALLRRRRRPRVQAHAHRERAAAQRVLRLRRRRGRVPGAPERDEERVALRVDLDAAVRGERVPQGAPVLRERGP